MHDDVIKWKHFSRYSPFVRGIHRSPVNYPHKGQWRGALMFSLINVWINDWVNNREAGDFRRYCAHYDIIVMDRCLATHHGSMRWHLLCFISCFPCTVQHCRCCHALERRLSASVLKWYISCNFSWKKHLWSKGNSIIIYGRADVFMKCELIHFFLKFKYGTFT